LREAVRIFRPSADPRDSRFIVIVAGEASADLHGSSLVKAIRRLDPGVVFCGIGGEKMKQAGVKILISSSEMAVVGLTEALFRLHTIAKASRTLKSLFKDTRPDLLILIDYPDFNIHMAGIAKRSRVPVLYYISPQVWAWRGGRVRKISRRVDRMAVILPFEEAFYRERGVDVTYVGHPLMDAIPPGSDTQQIGSNQGLDSDQRIMALLPGSRKEEVRNLAPRMVRAAEILRERYHNIRCVLPLAPTIHSEFVQSFTASTTVDVEISKRGIYEVLRPCDVALVASGTATLETAIMGIPMVIAYKVSPLSYWVGRMVIKVPHIGLVNLVAGERVVPELIQDEVTPERLAYEASIILDCREVRENMVKKLRDVRDCLGKGGASERTAEIAVQMIEGSINGQNHLNRR
jgi:lipid-A-disaccharide synthase